MGVTKLKSVSVKRRRPASRSLIPRFGRMQFKLPKLPKILKLPTHFALPSNRRSRWPLLIAILFLLIAIPATFWLNSRTSGVEAAWWDYKWQYRQAVSLSNNSNYNATNIPYRATLDTAQAISQGKMKEDGTDIRVVDVSGRIVRFQVEQSTLNTATTGIWIEGSVPSKQSAQYFIYYGNNSASTVTFENDVLSVVDDGTTIEMKDGSGYSTRTNYGQLHDMRKNGTNIGVNGNYPNTTSYPGNWWDDRPFTRTLLASGPLFVEVKMEDTAYGSYSSYGTVIQAFKNGVVHNRVFLNYNTSGTEQLYYYLQFDNDTRRSIWINGSGTLVDQAGDSTWLYQTDLQENWLAQYWEADGRYGGMIYTPNGDSFYRAMTYGTSYAFINYAHSKAFVADQLREIRWSVFSGIGDSDEIKEKGGVYGAQVVSMGNEETTPGPAAYWKLDEGSGQVKDSTQNSNNSTTMTAVWADSSQCISGKCLRFSETGHQVIIPDSKPLSSTTAVTIQGWFNATSTAGETSQTFLGMIQKDGGYSGFAGYGFRQVADGRIQAMLSPDNQVGNGKSLYSTSYLEKNKWYFISMTYDQATTTWSLYINGKLDSQSTTAYTGAIYDSGDPFRIGRGDNRYFHGLIDEVKVYPYARTQEQILQDYNLGSAVAIGQQQQSFMTEGLVGYWKMDESSSPSLNSSGVSNNLTWTRNVSSSNGKFSTGITFDGFGDYAETASDVLDVGTNSVSLATWIKASNSPSQPFIIDNRATWGGTPAGITLSTTATTHYATIRLADGVIGPYEFAGTSSILDDQWHHVVGVIDRDQKKVFIYVDGQLQGNHDLDPALGSLTSTGAMRFGLKGTADSATNALNGTLDETRIYNRALKPNEVEKIYNYAPGPVGYWKLDENTGTTANDSSGNGITGTLSNNPSWTNGKYGSALTFNGSNSAVDLGSGKGVYTGAITLSAWVKTTTSKSMGILSRYANHGYYTYKLTLNSSGQVVFNRGYDGSWSTDVTSSSSINDGDWHFVTAAFDHSNMYIFIDGKLEATQPETRSSDPTILWNLCIGTDRYNCIVSGTTYFDGQIDEVKIYNYARTPQQIVEDMNAGHPTGGSPISSKLLHLNLDEGTGTVAHDSGFNGDDGDLVDGPTWTEGKFNKGLSFDGLNDRIQAFSADPFEFTGDEITFSTWIYHDSSDTDGGNVFSKPWNGGGQYNYRVYFQGANTLSVYLFGSTAWTTSVSSSIPADVWIHLAVTIDASRNVNIYVNGELVKSDVHTITDWTPSSGDSNHSLLLGSLFPYASGWAGHTGYSFKGKLDEIKIYTSALTPDQIKLDMNQGSSAVYGGENEAADLSDGEGDPPVGYWSLDEKTGTAANDLSGNNNTGSFTNLESTDWLSSGSCKVGACLDFDGVNEYLTVTDSGTSSLDLTSEGTISVWAKPDREYPSNTSSNTYRNFVNKSAGGATTTITYTFHWYGTDATSNLRLCLGDGTNANCQHASVGALDTSRWYHFSASWDASSIKYYMDGKLIETDSNSIVVRTTDDPVHIGGRAFNSEALSWDGKLDEVKVYNYARTPAQIAYDYNRGAPVAHYKFDECQGTTINDSSGNNYAGTWSGSGGGTQTSAGTCSTADTAWGNGATGKFNGSLNFDNTDDRVEISPDITQGLKSFSLAAWVKPSAFSSPDTIIGNWQDRTVLLRLTTGGILEGYFRDTSDFQYGGNFQATLVPLNQWTHVTMTYDGEQLIGYVNGKAGSTIFNISATPSVRSASSYLGIGGANRNGSEAPFNGQIDDVQIFNYALSADQIAKLYNGSSAVRFGD